MPRTTAAEGRGDGRRERWTSHRALRHREFVDAAVRVIAREGPELSMDAVAAEAGVTKPVLYRYFEDKAALLRSLDERGAELLFTRLLPAISTDGPGLARVRAAVGAYFEVIDEFPNLYWLIARQPLAVRDDGVPVDEHDEFIAGALAGIMVEVLAAFDLDVAAAQPWAHGLTGL
ncbi:MAG: TetR/AcrR family transcriptional regulator, partial [Acidimicrobiales bacterium]